MNIYTIIPARGGSKRLKGKNIFPVCGKPMIHYTIDAARKSTLLDPEKIFVSTEDPAIKEAVGDRAKVIDRPASLAGDKVWTQDVVNHFIETLNIDDDDLIVILQANSPQISPEVIDRCIRMCIDNNLWQVHTVDEHYVNNGAIHVYPAKVRDHKGKANYNGVVVAPFIDVHTIEDVKSVEKILCHGG